MIKLRKTQIVIKPPKKICEKTQKLKLWQKSRTQIVGKLKTFKTENENSDKTKNKVQVLKKLKL